jgi:hypothetical protein
MMRWKGRKSWQLSRVVTCGLLVSLLLAILLVTILFLSSSRGKLSQSLQQQKINDYQKE